MQLLTSPQLNDEDWNAIVNGEKAKTDEVIYKSICNPSTILIPLQKRCLEYVILAHRRWIPDIKFVVCKILLGIITIKLLFLKTVKEIKFVCTGLLTIHYKLLIMANVSLCLRAGKWASRVFGRAFREFCELYNNKMAISKFMIFLIC